MTKGGKKMAEAQKEVLASEKKLKAVKTKKTADGRGVGSKILSFLQELGKALQIPVAVLPFAAILTRFGALGIQYTDEGQLVMDNLALMFAIGTAFGLAKDKRGEAALSGTLSQLFYVPNGVEGSYTGGTYVLGIGVLGGIVSGITAAVVYEKFKDIKLPTALAFFGGRRFVPMVLNGTDFVGGDINAFTKGVSSSGLFQSGFFPVMMGGIPAIALAMIFTANKDRRKEVAGFLGGVAAVSFISAAGAVYFFAFTFVIKKMNLPTPGRETDVETGGSSVQSESAKEVAKKASKAGKAGKEELIAQTVADVLGDNLLVVDNCITRLRLTVKDNSNIDDAAIKASGAFGVKRLGKESYQVVIGPGVEKVADILKKLTSVGAAISSNVDVGTAGYYIGNTLNKMGDVCFGNLPILFAISVAMAYTKDSGVAAITAVVGFLVLNGMQAALLHTQTVMNLVIAIAHNLLDEKNIEDNLVFHGFATFFDEPKTTSKKIIKQLSEKGIATKILTGDDEIITRSICKKVDFKITKLYTGKQIEEMDEKQLSKAVIESNVFVKLSPIHKSLIIKTLKKQNHVVGFMGDGINDAPVLRESDVAISFKDASNIAQEAADLILLEDSLLPISIAVHQGREAKYSVAVNNATQVLKDIALFTTDSNKENGVKSDETMSLQNYIVSVIEETTPSSNNYDFSKAEIDSTNKVDLNYSFDLSLLTSSYYGVNESGFSSSGALSSIASQIVNAYNITSKIVSVKDLSKQFKSGYGIKQINFEVKRGTVYGYLGPNGAEHPLDLEQYFMKYYQNEIIKDVVTNIEKHNEKMTKKVTSNSKGNSKAIFELTNRSFRKMILMWSFMTILMVIMISAMLITLKANGSLVPEMLQIQAIDPITNLPIYDENNLPVMVDIPNSFGQNIDQTVQMLLGAIATGSMGCILFAVFVVMNGTKLVATEVESGVLVNLITTNLTRKSIILTKMFTFMGLIAISVLIQFIVIPLGLSIIGVAKYVEFSDLTIKYLGYFLLLFFSAGFTFLASCYFNKGGQTLGQKILTVLKAHRAFLESEGFINFSGDSISDMDYVITNVNSVDAFVFEAVKYLYKKNGVNNLSQLGKELSTAKQIALKESRMIDFAFAAAQISNKSVVPQQAAQAPVEPNVSVQQTPQVSPPTQPQVVLENQNVEKPKDVVINQNLEVIAKQPSKDNNAQQKVVPQKNKSKKGLKITLILLSLLLILGGGAGAAV
ncbi:hypothetical protein FQR65_LT16623 [Abscondita terminalis]|nr:hypothetical protein FQR65_LT16623 [Abscondita terminalis]